MKHLLPVTFVLLSLVILAACQRGDAAEELDSAVATWTLPSVLTPPSPVITDDESDDLSVEDIEDEMIDITAEAEPESAPVNPGFEGRFSDLRFASSGTGMPQVDFPAGTEEIYAVWNYDGMSASDTIERLWYLNDELLYERREQWDYVRYGSVGAVRDICIYDYVDGIDPGNWRVELYLNGELQLTGEFTVGGPNSTSVSPLPEDQRTCISFYQDEP
ncbi:MAG: hypothetical protein M3220_08785 [Chloroflexota bacterium]|nr:hypothetical protein [Chloroflexota bacterium]